MEELQYFQNCDLQNIITPIDANKLEELLIRTSYDLEKPIGWYKDLGKVLT